jgi:hypothetical protein
MRQGFIQCGRKLIGIICLVLISCLDLYLQKKGYEKRNGGIPLQGTWMDYLFFLLGGRRRFDPSVDQVFVIPVRWLLYHLYLLYAVLYYPCRDLQYSVGDLMMIKGGSRRNWWLAKCIWNMTYMAAAYVLTFVTVICFCAAAGERAGLAVTPELVHALFDTGSSYAVFAPELSVYVCLLPCLISMALGLLLMLLSFLVKPVIAFLIAAVILIASTYLSTGFLVGNYAMPYRSAAVLSDGFLLWQGLAAGILILVVCVAAGMRFFKTYDLLRHPDV